MSAPRALLMCAASVPPPLSTTVYSLVTGGKSSELGRVGGYNMNIMTYVTPVAHAPERWFAVSLFHGTASHGRFLAESGGVLQILASSHAQLVSLLGQQSMRDVDKLAALEAGGHTLRYVRGWPVLADAVGCFEPEVARSGYVQTCGDHDVALCKVRW